MIALTDAQIQQIEYHLNEKGVTYAPLKEELLDHICCLIEEEMWNHTCSFDVAYQNALVTFEEVGFYELQEQILIYSISKTLSMKKVLVMSAMLLVFMVFGANAIQNASIYSPPSIVPVKNGKTLITSQFGMRMHPVLKVKKHHLGIDFKAAIGTPVYSTADGIVEKIKTNEKGYGKHLKIKHDDEYQTLYSHLSEFNVEEGQEVKKGDIIAYTGNSGASRTPHLHYEVILNGKRVNPEKYFTE